MTRLITYLTFNGNCREAMQFYQQALGGELQFQTVGESPLSEKMPAEMKRCIVHASLTRDGLVIMGTDMVWEKGLIKGNTISMMLNCCSETEIRDYYNKLADGGTATHPVQVSFSGALSGDLTDKFGNQWLLYFDRRSAKM